MNKYTLSMLDQTAEQSFGKLIEYSSLSTQKFFCVVAMPVFMGVLIYAVISNDRTLSIQSLISFLLTLFYLITQWYFKRAQELINYTFNISLMVANVTIVILDDANDQHMIEKAVFFQALAIVHTQLLQCGGNFLLDGAVAILVLGAEMLTVASYGAVFGHALWGVSVLTLLHRRYEELYLYKSFHLNHLETQKWCSALLQVPFSSLLLATFASDGTELHLAKTNLRARQTLKIADDEQFQNFVEHTGLVERQQKRTTNLREFLKGFYVQQKNYKAVPGISQQQQLATATPPFAVRLNGKTMKLRVALLERICCLQFDEWGEWELIRATQDTVVKKLREVENYTSQILEMLAVMPQQQAGQPASMSSSGAFRESNAGIVTTNPAPNPLSLSKQFARSLFGAQIRTKCIFALNQISNLKDHFQLCRTGTLKTRLTNFMLDIFLYNLSKTVQKEAELRQIKFVVINKVPQNKLRLYTDGFRLTQIILSLVENSFHAMPADRSPGSGQGSVVQQQVSSQQQQQQQQQQLQQIHQLQSSQAVTKGLVILQVSTLAKFDDILRFKVLDKGCGFRSKEQLQAQIKAFQAPVGARAFHFSHSLGLQIAFRIAGALGPVNNLQFKSRKRGGSSVSFYLNQSGGGAQGFASNYHAQAFNNEPSLNSDGEQNSEDDVQQQLHLAEDLMQSVTAINYQNLSQKPLQPGRRGKAAQPGALNKSNSSSLESSIINLSILNRLNEIEEREEAHDRNLRFSHMPQFFTKENPLPVHTSTVQAQTARASLRPEPSQEQQHAYQVIPSTPQSNNNL